MTLWARWEGGFGTLEGGQAVPHGGDMFGGATPSGPPVAIPPLLPPVLPGKFIGLWNNFHALAAKQGNAIPDAPLYFLKAPSSLLAPGGVIRPPGATRAASSTRASSASSSAGAATGWTKRRRPARSSATPASTT